MSERIEFTIDEINLAGACFRESRTEMLNQLYRIVPEIKDYSVRSVGESLFAKLKSMSDDDFAECGFVELYAR